MLAGQPSFALPINGGAAGPSSATGRSDGSNKLDGANWSVNYGGTQVAGGLPVWLLVGAAVLGVWLWQRKR